MIRAVAVAVATIAAGGLLSFAVLRRVRRLRGQMLVIGVVAALLPCAAIVAAGVVMLKPAEAVAIGATAVAAVATAGLLSWALSASLASGVERFQDAAVRLAEGDLTARIPEDGAAELREMAASFNVMAAELARLFETRRNLVAWASHDLRAPLASLQAMIEALEDGLAEPDVYLPAMRAQVRTLSGLVDDIFELSRIETGTLSLAVEDVSVATLAAGCVRAFEPQALRLGMHLSIDASDEAFARCDPEKVERVLLNLLSNALRHTPADGAVGVLVSRGDDGGVLVAVEDTGAGLAPEALARVFESFWRGDDARTPSDGGAGLGLAIARGLVEAHGGRIWAEPRDEGGLRFAFTLPAA